MIAYIINLNIFLIISSADNESSKTPIITKPLIKTSGKNREELKEIREKNERTPDRGNCYIEPIQHRDNCVTSELYLIT